MPGGTERYYPHFANLYRCVPFYSNLHSTQKCMAEVLKFSDFKEFILFNESFIEQNPMLYYYLNVTIDRIIQHKVGMFEFFNITNDSGHHLVWLKTVDDCLLFANAFDDEIVSLLTQEVEFKKFKRYAFAGTKPLIDALFKQNQATYTMSKHRIIYKCGEVSKLFKYSSGQLQMGDLSRLDELAKFSVSFAKDFDGKEEEFDHMKQIVFDGIMNKNFYQWNHGNNICAIAQSMYGEYDFPVIGHVYTNPDFRKQGYAASIVHSLTKGLLNAGHDFCMLSADATNPASNGAFIKVGYKSTVSHWPTPYSRYDMKLGHLPYEK